MKQAITPLSMSTATPISRQRMQSWLLAGLPRHLLALLLIGAWVLTVTGLPQQLPTQAASWLTFIGLLITPGYLLANMITWQKPLDALERLAIALPAGVAVLAVPGLYTLLTHQTIVTLASGWAISSAIVIGAWVFHGAFRRFPARINAPEPLARPARWQIVELLLLGFLGIAFAVMYPILSLPTIDGDAYAVNTFVADALAGLPLNATEPIFGTTLGPGVRMLFNQSLTISYLWTYLAGIEQNTWIAVASRSMIALWSMLATYTLAKAARNNDRRFALFTVIVQLLIYLAAPFFRGDNVSLFFFERINADKFMVPVTMLPIIFAFAIHFLRRPNRADWLMAALATLAVSTIHPLIAAMVALILGAFGAFHLLVNIHSRIAWRGSIWLWIRDAIGGKSATIAHPVWQRTLALWALVLLVMTLPIIQLVLSRTEAPLATTYPATFDGWQMGEKMVPVLPFVHVRSMDWYGPVPEMAALDAIDADSDTNPFLIWRFAVNMNRRRLILFDIDNYISDPSVIFEPPYLLALLLLPLLFWKIRSDLGAQFAVSSALAVLFVMFNPILTPIIGGLVVPWILWRFVWVLPYALIIALAGDRILSFVANRLGNWPNFKWLNPARTLAFLTLGLTLFLTVLAQPAIAQNLKNLRNRAAAPFFYPTPPKILDHLQTITTQTGPVNVLANERLSVTIPAFVANANVVAHRAPTTSEVFPRAQQADALQRLIDQDYFFRTPYLTAEGVNILNRYDIRYVVVESGSKLDMQLRLAGQWFQWLLDDQSYSLYAVTRPPEVTPVVAANSAMVNREWDRAKSLYELTISQEGLNVGALVGLGELAQTQGDFEQALSHFHKATNLVDIPALHYTLGQLYHQLGATETSLAQYDLARQGAPQVARFHEAMGTTCLSMAAEGCAAEQFKLAATNTTEPDAASRLITEANLWRQQNRMDRAVPLYEQAVTLAPSSYNQFILENAYREAGEFAAADAVLQTLKQENPLASEVLVSEARVLAAQGDIDGAVTLYRQAILRQQRQAIETINTRLELAGLLIEEGRLEVARTEIDEIRRLQPFNWAGYKLQGDLFDRQFLFGQSINAYYQAFRLDPSQLSAFIALSNQIRAHGGAFNGLSELLQTAIELNPDEANLYLALGDQLQQQSEWTAAIDAYQQALDRLDAYTLSPQLRDRASGESRAFIHARIARVYEQLGQIEPALNHYRAAVAAAPDEPWVQATLGDALRRSGDLTEAETAYTNAIELDDTYLNAYLGLAQFAIDQENFDQAEALLLKVANADPDNSATYIYLGQLAQLRGDSEAAHAWYRNAAAIPPNAQTNSAILIDALIRFGDIQTALNYALTAAEQRPGDSEIQLRIGQLYKNLGDYTAAETALLRTQQMNPTNSQTYIELADLYLLEGRPQAALDVYRQALTLQPDQPRVYLAAAQILTNQADYPAAIDMLNSGLQQVSEADDLYAALANLHLQQNRPDQALQTLQAGIETRGETPTLQLALAYYHTTRANFDTATDIYTTLLAATPENAQVYLNLANLQASQGLTDSAESNYRQAITLAPDVPNHYLDLGRLYQQNAQTETAVSTYRQVLQIAPNLASTYNVLAGIALAEGDDAQAAQLYQQGLSLAPTNGNLLTGYAQLRLAQEIEPVTVLATLNNAIAIAETSETLLARAKVYQSLGQWDAAEADLARALEKSPGAVNALVALGDLYLAQEDFDNARQAYQQVVALLPGSPVGYLRLGNLAFEQDDRDTAADFAAQAREVEPGFSVSD